MTDFRQDPNRGKIVFIKYAVKDVENIKINLNTSVSDEYRDFITETGIPNRRFSISSTSTKYINFLSPHDVITLTRDYTDLGMPCNLIIIGLDCEGNVICLDKNGAKDIYFFDHDFLTVTKIADNLSQLLSGQETGV